MAATCYQLLLSPKHAKANRAQTLLSAENNSFYYSPLLFGGLKDYWLVGQLAILAGFL
jgi:hypothetical protein